VVASLQVTQKAVRRFLLEKQGLLSAQRTKSGAVHGVMTLVQQLECVQLDPVAAVERNQHLVLQTRLPGYQTQSLMQLLEERLVFEYWAQAQCIIPMQDYPLFESVRRHRQVELKQKLDSLGSVVQEVIDRLEKEGPLPSRAFTSDERVQGYWDIASPRTKNTSHALSLLHDMGRIHVVRREGTTRYFDVSQRAIPKQLLDEADRTSDIESKQAMMEKYMRAYRLFDPGDARFGWQHLTVAERRQEVIRRVQSGIVTALDIDGVQRPYYLLTEDIDQLRSCESRMDDEPTRAIHFLPPLDNMLWSRERIADLFDFSYRWEVYMPANKRQFGYYAMPILVGDTLIGRLDPALHREKGILDIRLLQFEPSVRVTKTLQKGVWRALETFAKFHGAKIGIIERTLWGETEIASALSS